MKKYLKVAIICICICIFLILCNFVRNYILIKKLYEKNEQFSFANNYSIKTVFDVTLGDAHWKNEIETQVKDNIILVNSINYDSSNNCTKYIYWKDQNTNEKVSLKSEDDGEYKEFDNDDIIENEEIIRFSKRFDFNKMIIDNIFNILIAQNDVYKLKYNSIELYVDKNSSILVEEKENNSSSITTEYKENVIENIEKPII